MPGGDRTGPWGLGPMSGRGGGYCLSRAAGGRPGYGYGLPYGYGRGRGCAGPGWGRWPGAAMPVKERLQSLKDEERWLEEQLKSLRDEVKEMEREQDRD
jgi:hypothetical protein